jgi:hypothetical protein
LRAGDREVARDSEIAGEGTPGKREVVARSDVGRDICGREARDAVQRRVRDGDVAELVGDLRERDIVGVAPVAGNEPGTLVLA